MPPALLLVGSRAQPGFEKSRSLTERSSVPAAPRRPPTKSLLGTAALPAARVSADPAVAGWRRVLAARTPATVPSSAAKGRGAPGSRGSRSPKFNNRCERSGAHVPPLSRLSPQSSCLYRRGGSLRRRKGLQKFAPGPRGACPRSSRSGKFSAAAVARRLPPEDARAGTVLRGCQRRPRSGALLPGAAGEGVLLALPKTPAREPQELALGSWRDGGKENKDVQFGLYRRAGGLCLSVCLPESAHLRSRPAASATLSATLSPYPARAQHLSATSQPLKIAHDVTPRPSHWLASLSGGRARPSPWRLHPRRFFSGPAEAHGMR